MKKVFAILLTVFVVTIFTMGQSQEVGAQEAEPAQVVHSLQCCDGNAVVRCRLQNWTPVGNPCYCYGQGWGYAC